jgi:hypothetical protein
MQGTNTPEFTNPARWKLTMLEHFREMHRRNDLLQVALDKSIAEVARLQAEALESQPLPAQPALSRFEQFRRKSHARMMAS